MTPARTVGGGFGNAALTVALACSLLPRAASGAWNLNLPPPASGIAREIYDLHTLVLWICGAIFVVVFVPMAIALVRHRKAAGHPAAKFHDNFRLEVAWTVVPVLILAGMAWPATQTIISMKDTTASELTIKATGHQWKWEYEYLGTPVRFLSSTSTPREQIDGSQPKGPHYLLEVDRPMVVPTGRKVRVVLTATDVIHAWWVPELGIKQDAIPGFIRETWFRVDAPGIYRGQCAELCGVGHGFMPIVVEAVPPARFDAWKAEQEALLAAAAASSGREFTLAELVAAGEKVYLANCAACHQANGMGIPGAFPALDNSAVVNGPLAAHLEIVFKGRPGTAMAAFGKQLSDLDLAAVLSYERNAWHNRTAQPVQPAQVAALRRNTP